MRRALLSHPTGSPFAQNAVLALDAAVGHCDVATTLLYDRTRTLAKIIAHLPRALRLQVEAELSRREWLPSGRTGVYLHPAREILRLSLMRSGLSQLLGFDSARLADWIFRALDQTVARRELSSGDYSLVYAYEDCARQTFRKAKSENILCMYDLPILHYRSSVTLQQEEAERFPEFASSLAAANEPMSKLERKDEELALADHIFVASTATKKSLVEAQIANERISIVPYGAPIDYFQPGERSDSVFRVLFVGRVGPRKGAHYLLHAWKELQFKNAELKLVGINEFPPRWLEQFSDSIAYQRSVPHRTLRDIYTNSSVLVLPSIVEGFGMVLLEAMACGVPVITTPNSAGPDIVEEGVDGFVIPMRDVDALKEQLDWCMRHPKELAGMGKAARRKAELYSWERYRATLAAKVRDLLEKR